MAATKPCSGWRWCRSSREVPGAERADASAPRLQSALRKIVELGCIVDEDAVAYRLVGCPIENQIDQHRIIRLGLWISYIRVRPVAAPDEPLGRGLDIGAGDRTRVGVGRRPHLGVGV